MGKADCRATRPDQVKTYMSEDQLAYFRSRLLRWRQVLLARERGGLAALAQESGRPADPIDQGGQDVNRQRLFEERQRGARLLREIDAALARIEDGSYGYCLESGEEIGLRRLEALPIATLSLEMQEQREHRQRFRQRNRIDEERSPA